MKNLQLRDVSKKDEPITQNNFFSWHCLHSPPPQFNLKFACLHVFDAVQDKIWNLDQFQVQFCIHKAYFKLMKIWLHLLLPSHLTITCYCSTISSSGSLWINYEGVVFIFLRNSETTISHFKSANAIVCTSFIPFQSHWSFVVIF